MIRVSRHRFYSIGEKKKYFREMLRKKGLSESERRKYQEKLTSLENIKPKRFDVFITNDSFFNKGANPYKSRRVVILKNFGDFLDVVPVKKNSKYVVLDNFTGDRMIAKNNVLKNFSIDDLYDNAELISLMKNDFLSQRDIKNVNRIFFDKND